VRVFFGRRRRVDAQRLHGFGERLGVEGARWAGGLCVCVGGGWVFVFVYKFAVRIVKKTGTWLAGVKKCCMGIHHARTFAHAAATAGVTSNARCRRPISAPTTATLTSPDGHTNSVARLRRSSSTLRWPVTGRLFTTGRFGPFAFVALPPALLRLSTPCGTCFCWVAGGWEGVVNTIYLQMQACKTSP
jgi:hypothetical protein